MGDIFGVEKVLWWANLSIHFSQAEFLLVFMQGDVIYINILGRPAIILNSLQATRDLFEKSGANFSDRPYFLVVNDLWDDNWSTTTFIYILLELVWDRLRPFSATENVGVNNVVFFSDILIRNLYRYSDPFSNNTWSFYCKTSWFLPSLSLVVSKSTSILISYIPVLRIYNDHKLRFTSLLSLKTVYGDSVISTDETLLGKFKQVAAMIAEVGDGGGTIIDIIPTRSYSRA